METDKPKTGLMVGFVLGAIIFLFVSWHIVIAYDTLDDRNLVVAIMEGFAHMEQATFELYMTESFLRGMGYSLLIVVITFLYLFGVDRKTMFGKEQGSAEWATKEDEKKLKDKDFYKNMILSNDVFMSMNTRKTRLNNNIVVSGGSGSGKTRFVAKPNILQANCSYVITDPKGELLSSTGKILEGLGYEVKVFNLIEKEHSCCYNPFVYIHKESDVFKLIKQLIKNTNPPENKGGGDPFWEKSEEALLQAIFFYLWLECPPEEQNFKNVMRLINIAGASEEDEKEESDLDIMFRILEEEKGPAYIPCKQYKIFKMASGKTAKSILISVGVRLSVFNLEDIENLTLTDNLDLKTVGDKKTVLYIVIPDSDGSFNFLVSMLYSQLFDELYFQADFGELKWENNKILFRSKESLVSQKNQLLKLWDEYSKTEGEKKKAELHKQIRKTLEGLDKEFGLPFELPDREIKKRYIKKCLGAINTCLLRLKNRRATLAGYIEDWCKSMNKLRVLEKSESKHKEARIAKITEEIRALELRMDYEYGLKKKYPKQSQFLWIKKEYTPEQLKQVNKEYLADARFLEKELQRNPKLYGTRQDFEDKLEKVKALQKEIKQLEKRIKETSKKQVDVRTKLYKKIERKKKDIQRIELIAEYEFGIKELKTKKNGGRLPVHVRCILDEFANIAPIPDFAKLVATMRSREISVTIIIQNISQLKEMYKDNWESLTGNCDTFVFLGGQEQSTLEYVSKKLGKATIDKRSQGKSKGKQGSSSENWDTLGRELMTADEIGKMKGSKCILFIRGFSPFLSNKFNLEKHPRYEELGETDNASDPRLFDFKSKFNTREIALGVHGEHLGVGKEFRSLLDQSISKYINELDKCAFIGGNITLEDKRIFNESNIVDPFTIKENREIHDKTIKRTFIKLANEHKIDANSLSYEIRERLAEELKGKIQPLSEIEVVTTTEEFEEDLFGEENAAILYEAIEKAEEQEEMIEELEELEEYEPEDD